MEREIADRNILDKFCEDFCRIVEKYGRYIIVSGFLVIASGRTRGTEDIDMILERIPLGKFTLLFKELEREGFECVQSSQPEEAYEYLVDNTSIRFRRRDRPLPEMEVKFVKDELDLFQIGQRVKIPLTGLDVYFSNVNINIAFKEEYLKSPKDLDDAKHLRLIYRETIDEDEIRRVKELIRRLRL